MAAMAAAAGENEGEIIDEDIYDVPPEAGGCGSCGCGLYITIVRVHIVNPEEVKLALHIHLVKKKIIGGCADC